MSEENQSKYKSEYQSLKFYSIGGRWVYAIMRLEDSSKVSKVRLAKCKKTEAFPPTKKYEWEDVPVQHVADFSQVQKINFKHTDNFSNIAEQINKELAIIKKAEEAKEKAKEEKKAAE